VSEFKVGDRITADGYYGATHTGVVVGVGPSGLIGGSEYLIRPDGGPNVYVRKDTAVPADAEVRKGDRVRMIYEGVVTKVYADGKPEIDHRYLEGAPDAVQILERAKPDLRPGDVVVSSFGGIYLIGHRNVHYTSTTGSVIDAGETPTQLA
jgi:hypothetical protein